MIERGHSKNYRNLRQRAKDLFAANPAIPCPYFATDVILNAEGLHHLRYSAERERSKPEQMLKFRLLPLALQVIRKAGTVLENRRIWQPIGKGAPMAYVQRKKLNTGASSQSSVRGPTRSASSCVASEQATSRFGA